MIGYVFDKLPEWDIDEIPGGRGAWAPDISFYNGIPSLLRRLNIRQPELGHRSRHDQTLDPVSPKYRWVDEGMVLRSYQDKDDWNAIDPNLFVEDKDHVWLSWGSFWGGIKMKRTDPATGKPATDAEMYSLCSRDRAQPIGGSVEAPFIVRHGDDFYLFVSYDRCCRGVNSTYNVVVGRSKNVRGPYGDKEGKALMNGAAAW